MKKNDDPTWFSDQEFEKMFDNQYGAIDTSPKVNAKLSLDAAVSRDYDFAIAAVIRRAWQATNGFKLTFVAASLLTYIVAFIVAFLLSLILLASAAFVGFELYDNVWSNFNLDPTTTVFAALLDYAIQIILTAVTTTITIGLFSLTLDHLRKKDANADQVFSGMKQFFIPACLTLIILTILVSIGFLFLIIPGVYLSVAYILVYFIIVDHPGVSAWQALESSRKIVQQHWFKFLGLLLTLALLNIIGALCLVVGLFWTIPMSYLALGIVYTDIFDQSA